MPTYIYICDTMLHPPSIFAVVESGLYVSRPPPAPCIQPRALTLASGTAAALPKKPTYLSCCAMHSKGWCTSARTSFLKSSLAPWKATVKRPPSPSSPPPPQLLRRLHRAQPRPRRLGKGRSGHCGAGEGEPGAGHAAGQPAGAAVLFIRGGPLRTSSGLPSPHASVVLGLYIRGVSPPPPAFAFSSHLSLTAAPQVQIFCRPPGASGARAAD